MQVLIRFGGIIIYQRVLLVLFYKIVIDLSECFYLI